MRDGWTTGYVTLEEFEKRLLTHRQINRKKDGKAFVPGVVQGDRRKKTAVSELTALVIDLDKGEDLKEVNAAIRAKGLYAIVHTTFSHLDRETEINLDAYRKFVGNKEVTPEGLQRYLIEVSQYRPWVVEQVEIASDCRDTAQGVVCVARHAPLPKLRIVFPLRKPFKRRDVMKAGFNQADFEKQWKAKYAKFANSLCVVWDKTCTDVSRCFFHPSCKPGVRPGARKIEGQLLDLDTIEVEAPSDQACVGELISSKRDMHHQKGQQHTFKGFNLKSWIAQYGSKFEIETTLRANKEDAFFRSERDAGGVHIECPFEDEHSEADGTGTFVVNASDNEGHAGFGIYCCHNSCLTRRGNGTGNGVDRLFFIHKMLEDGWLGTHSHHTLDLATSVFDRVNGCNG